MRCPYCRTDDSRVVDSRTVDDGIRRRRECLDCGSRFTTYERVESAGVLVIKQDGRREAFAREKLLAGVRRACEKRPLEASAVETLVTEVEREVHARGQAEVPSSVIGELTMERLKHLDQIAYVRFASVYRQFADLESLRVMLDELVDGRLRAVAAAESPQPPADPGGEEGGPRVVPLTRPRWRGRGQSRRSGA